MIREQTDGEVISIAVVKAWDANWTALDNPLVVELASAATTVRGAAPSFVVRLPGSDARRWRDLGVPAICYGPQPTLSAGIDDYVNEQDVAGVAKFSGRPPLALTRGGAMGYPSIFAPTMGERARAPARVVLKMGPPALSSAAVRPCSASPP